jgi:hypothetical protein
MIHTNSITAALYTILSSDTAIVSSGTKIDLYKVHNTNLNRTPWVGIATGEMGFTIEYEPRRANITAPWMATVTIPVIIQAADRDKTKAMQKLGDLEHQVFSAVNCYDGGQRTLLDTVNMIVGFTSSPYQSEELEDLFSMRQVDITAEVLT